MLAINSQELVEYVKAANDTVAFICPKCNKDFTRSKSDSLNKLVQKQRNFLYCSRSCASEAQKKSIHIKCGTCLKDITVRPDRLVKSKNGICFCSRSCAATYSNLRTKVKHGFYAKENENISLQKIAIIDKAKINYICKNCEKMVNHANAKFCSRKCFQDHRMISSVKNNTNSAITGKRYLLMTQGHQCSVCKYTEWMSKPIPLELDHKDGNAENNNISNLRLICLNCHGQTPTYRALNIGQW